MEDIITLIDGRETIVSEVALRGEKLKKYLADQFQQLIDNMDFRDALEGHLNYGPVSDRRMDIVLARMQKIVEQKEDCK